MKYREPPNCSIHVPEPGRPPLDANRQPAGTFTPSPHGVGTTDSEPPVLTRPLSCPYCGQAITVEYVPAPGARASCQCPYTGCQKISKIGGVAGVRSVRARWST